MNRENSRMTFLALGLTFSLVAFYNIGSAVASSPTLQQVTTADSSQGVSKSGGGDSWQPILSPDGVYVLFASSARSLALISNTVPMLPGPQTINAFLRNRTNGTTTLISVNLAGTGGGNGDSFPVGISTNGRYVVFESTASDLISRDTNNASDVFIRDLFNGTTSLISVSTNGGMGNADSRCPDMTPDGRYVAFVSSANNLIKNDTNNVSDIFVRDVQTTTTTLVSVNATPTGLTSGSYDAPNITPDGHYVVFSSTTTNFISSITNTSDIFVRNLVSGTTIWASTGARALLQTLQGTSKAVTYNHLISADGGFVVFGASQSALNTQPGIVLRYSTTTGLTDLVSTNASRSPDIFGGVKMLDMTPNGRFIAFVGGNPATLNVWDGQSGTTTLACYDVSPDPKPASIWCSSPTLDPTGQFIAFLATGATLVTNATVPGFHIYLRDLTASTTQLVDIDGKGAGSVNPSEISCLSTNGRGLAFSCPADGLVSADRNRSSDVFVRDLTTNAVELVSIRNPALPCLSPNGLSETAAFPLSDDGRFVAFSSYADNLVANDTNSCSDIFVYDLQGGTNLLVSVAQDGVTSANASSFSPVISPDGRYVAFGSWATNLVAVKATNALNVFVRDLQSGATTLASLNSAGTGGGNYASTPTAISSGGRYVLFSSSALNLAAVTGTSPLGNNLFLRDVVAAKTYALSTDSSCGLGAMTPDGRYVIYADGSSTTNLYVWDVQAAKKVYTNTAALITQYAISPDGKQLVFLSGTSLYAVNRAAKTQTYIASGPLSIDSVPFSQDGKFFTYRSLYPSNFQIHLYSFETGVNQVISQNASGTVGNDASGSATIGFGDRFVAYRSTATNLVAKATNGISNVFLYDRQSGTTTLLSTSQTDGSACSSPCSGPTFSGDGKTLLFASLASELASQNYYENRDLFAFTLLYPGIRPLSNQGLSLDWLMATGSTAQVQFKSSLSDPIWQTLTGNVIIQGNRASLLDYRASSSQRFYRVVVQ